MKLPIISGKELIKILLKKGYCIKDQKGSHIHLRHATKKPITIPNHKAISKGTLKEIIKATELTQEDFE
jgi:predicted RNA binding protein YcfA (HicA-like mRNA interferase family)